MSGAVLFAVVLVVTLLLGPALIRWLRALSLRQHAYEDAPKTHAVKTGTPTMGGVLFLVGVALTLIVHHDALTVALAVLALGCGAIGIADDVLSIRRGRNRGLRARAKFLLTIIVGAAFLALVLRAPGFDLRGVVFSFGGHQLVAPLWLWLGLGLCAILATTHGVNLTDGLDGLAAGTMLPPLFVVAWLAARANLQGVAALDIAVAAACIGFLVYNRHPAKVFMGDTGSLTLGAVLSGSAIVAGNQLLLLLIGGVFAAEAVSVILQVAYFKTTRKRIFRMSPLHHHFELGGWPETKVTQRFWTASALLSLAGAAIVR